ncbi:MAG: preprotein translocase subunit YajC [Bacillota bacterium]|nr:preprotein translocase subunit YajC [Bacillota bacterium]
MSGMASILPLIVLLLVMYFLLIRPQKKREKEVNAMRSGVQVGDEIITIGGICGKIVKTKEESLIIQVGADKVKFEIMRWAVSKVVEEGKKPSASKAKPEDYDEEEVEVKKAKPKRMKKAAPVEEAVEEPAVEAAEEVAEEAETAEEK